MSLELPAREIGTSGVRASVVGLGTWAIGGWRWGGTDETESIGAIHAALDHGVSLIDTAPAYGKGVAEEIVGKAIAGRRENVVLATKCGLVWHTDKGKHFFDNDGPVHRYLGKESIIHEVEQSLKRLQTDYIDHYITHWQDPTTPIEETLEALETLKAQGKIRSIGASNVSVADLNAYVAAGGIDAVQEKYNLIVRDIENSLLPVCRENSISVLSYSSLALGLLTGKIGPERTFGGDDLRKSDPLFSTGNRARVMGFIEAIRPVADAHGATPAQIVIAYTLIQPGITFALCGARIAQQAIENAKAGTIELTTEESVLIGDAAALHLTGLQG